MKMKKIWAAAAALLLTVSSGILSGNAAGSYADESGVSLLTSTADAPSAYPETFTEYTALREAYPELYRVDEDSVYFINPNIANTQLDLIISSNQESSVDRNTYGCIFKPEEDGRYVVTVREYNEEILSAGENHFHYFYPVLKNYVVDVTDGAINVELKGSKSWYSEEQISEETAEMEGIELLACYDVTAADPEDVLDGIYFSFVNGQMPDGTNGYDSYITNVYDEYGTDSYFCVNYFYSDVATTIPLDRVVALEQDISSLETITWALSWCSGDLNETTDDYMEFSRIAAPEDGDLTVIVDDQETYLLTVEDGIFHHRKETSDLMGDVNNDGKFSVLDVVMLQKWLLGAGDLTCWQNADLCADDKINAFDLYVMKQKLIEKNTAGTPDNMPVIMDYYDEVTDEERVRLWALLASEYPDMDFSGFTFVYDPDHPLSNYYNGKLFSVHYKNILLHGYGNINCDDNVFAVIGTSDAVNFMVDPILFTQVDLEQEILSPLEVLSTCIDVEEPELILYADAYGEYPPRLAYRAVEISGDAEYILNAVTGEIIEYIPYYVV